MEREMQDGAVCDLHDYVSISSAFDSNAVIDVAGEGAQCELRERMLEFPFRKDYDALESPLQWPRLFDVSNWALFGAWEQGRRIGGAIAAWKTPGVDMLEERADLVVLWDLRVAPHARGQGIGSELFRAVEAWGRSRSCTELKVETQNVNVAACRLYQSCGCALAQVNRDAYRDLPEEVQLIWRKRLLPAGASNR